VTSHDLISLCSTHQKHNQLKYNNNIIHIDYSLNGRASGRYRKISRRVKSFCSLKSRLGYDPSFHWIIKHHERKHVVLS